MNRSALTVERALWWGPGLALVLILVLAPLLFTDFYLSQVITKALWLGIAAASLIFLAAYVGMVSLGRLPQFRTSPTYDPRFTNDRFGVAVHCAPERAASVREILRTAGAEEIRP